MKSTFEAEYPDQQIFEDWWEMQTIFGPSFKDKAQIMFNQICEIRPRAEVLPEKLVSLDRLERLNQDLRAGIYLNDPEIQGVITRSEKYRKQVEELKNQILELQNENYRILCDAKLKEWTTPKPFWKRLADAFFPRSES